MVKISVNENKKHEQTQATITIPVDIMKLKGWDGKTELYFTPFMKDPNEKITNDTPIILKEIKNGEKG